MIEFDTKCGNCKKPISLGVRDEQARMLLEKRGAFCEVCYESGGQAESIRRAA